MKKEEVPQDKGSLSEIKMSELCYAQDENGEFVTVSSTGWEPKTLALSASMSLIEERIAERKIAFLDGKLSSIPYFMELNKMDISILSSYIGIHKWIVKLHFAPKIFTMLGDKTLNKYAQTFNISIEELKQPFSQDKTNKNEA